MILTADNQNMLRKKQAGPTELFLKIVNAALPKLGEMIEGRVIFKEGSALFVDLRPFGTGIVYGREFINARDIIKSLKPGDLVLAKVVELENEEGYVELSLREAGREILWREAEDLAKDKTPVELMVVDANKGGLIVDWQGLQGFLPASQLSSAHYPRVEGGDKDKILEELKKMVGKKINAVIINCDRKNDKMIFSEKDIILPSTREALSKHKVNDVVLGEVTGVVDFGVFVKIEEELEGLVHISEIDWSLVEDPSRLFHPGDKVKVKIIAIENGKISLSIKALKPDPWQTVKDKYKKGDVVEGVVIRINKYGALVSLEEGVFGLLHVSEFSSLQTMEKKIELGKTYPFKITLFEPQDHRLTLSFIDAISEQPSS